MKKLVLAILLSCVPFLAAPGTSDWWLSPEAESIPFDPLTSGLTSTEVGPAIRELKNDVEVSASPGFTWGKSGNVSSSYLLNDTVPSNTAGRLVPVTTGTITVVFVTCETNSSATVEIRRRVGAVFTTIASTTLSSQRKKTDQLASPPSVSLDDELSVYISGSSIKNPVVGLIIQGTL